MLLLTLLYTLIGVLPWYLFTYTILEIRKSDIGYIGPVQIICLVMWPVYLLLYFRLVVVFYKSLMQRRFSRSGKR